MDVYYKLYGNFLYKQTAIINMDCIFFHDNWKKLEIPVILKKKQYNLVFWITRGKVKPEKNKILDGQINKLKRAFDSFAIYASAPLNAPPFPHTLLSKIPYSEKILVVGNNVGICNAFIDGKNEELDTTAVDYMLHLNIPGSEFIYGDTFAKDIAAEIDFKIPFDPYLYFNNKLLNFPKFYYDVNYLRKESTEVVYVAGPPHFGKTIFAKNLAKRWNYTYVTDNFSIKKNVSYVVDNDPLEPSDYIKKENIRIFVLGEHGISQQNEKLLSYHLTLHFIKVNNIQSFDTSKVKRYYEQKVRYPQNIKVEEITFLPYQLYNGWPYLTLHFSKKIKDK